MSENFPIVALPVELYTGCWPARRNAVSLNTPATSGLILSPRPGAQRAVCRHRWLLDRLPRIHESVGDLYHHDQQTHIDNTVKQVVL
jgi:hypothetical protein